MNAVAVSVRWQRISRELARQFFEQLSAFDFRIALAPSIDTFGELSFLATRYQLTAYDAAYLGLAQQLAVPLDNARRRSEEGGLGRRTEDLINSPIHRRSQYTRTQPTERYVAELSTPQINNDDTQKASLNAALQLSTR